MIKRAEQAEWLWPPGKERWGDRGVERRDREGLWGPGKAQDTASGWELRHSRAHTTRAPKTVAEHACASRCTRLESEHGGPTRPQATLVPRPMTVFIWPINHPKLFLAVLESKLGVQYQGTRKVRF